MFYERYLQLCERAKITPSAAATKSGFNRGTVSVWKKKYEAGMDVTPDQDVVNKICDFFGCSESWIRGISLQTEKAPALTVKDERDIARSVEKIMDDLASSGDLMFDGVPMSDEAKAAMAAAMRIGLEEAKRRNKETYTPKKYRKE